MKPQIVILALILASGCSSFVLILDDRTAEITTKALLAFYYDQRIISYILTEEEMESVAYELFKSALHNTYHFTFYDFIISDLTDDYKLPGTEEGITPHSHTHSYIVSSEAFFGRQDVIQSLFRQNPNAKWAIAITSFMEEKDLLEFYRKYWDLYNMAFIFTFWNTYKFKFPDNLITNITYAYSENCFLYLFNPFELGNDGLRGRFTKMDASEMETTADWAEIFYFYHNLMNNLHQYELKVVLGDDDLLVKIVSEDKFIYPDGELIATLMEKMNFKIKRIPLGEVDHLGSVLDNGTAIGVTGMLEYNEVDIIGNSRLMTDLGTNNTIFLSPNELSNSVFLVKKKAPKDKRLTVMSWENYKFPLNYFHTFIFILSVLFLTVMEIFFQWKFRNEQLNVCRVVVTMIDSATLIYGFIEESSRSLKKWTKIYQRLFLCSIILYAMFLSSVYKGNVVKDLNNALVYVDPMTVEDILETKNEVLYFTSIHTIYRKYVNDSTLLINKLRKRRGQCAGWGDCLRSVLDRDMIMLVRDTYALEARAQYWDNVTGSNLYHIVPEVPFSFFASVTVPKGSPYQKKLNEMILRCSAAGIFHHAQKKAKHDLELKHLRRYLVGQFIPEAPKKPINFQNIDMVLTVYLIMIFTSTLVFLCEVAARKLLKKTL